jgi:gamma-glutamylputrescine oxidase
MDQLQKDCQYQSIRLIEREELLSFIHSDRYIAGLHDDAAASIHPLAYTLGLARAAKMNGAIIHEHSKVRRIGRHGDSIHVETDRGIVTSKHAVLSANIGNSQLLSTPPRILPVATYMIATEQLANVSGTLMSPDVAVSDCNFILDYFRINSSRLLFGGGISYSGHPSSINAHYTRQRMLKVFPQLQSIKVEYAWHGMLDMSMNRAPDFGRVDSNIYYLQGFSGHGMALTTMAGKLAAESIAAHSEKFDLFSRIKHQPFPGGALRTPLFVLAMLWYRLRDAL